VQKNLFSNSTRLDGTRLSADSSYLKTTSARSI